ncbi:MAG: patatin-like phospholipase family protein [Thermotogaceae bacterium]|nr:patatin-like phospholipase family protein [Thermotogaceae bacterium]
MKKALVLSGGGARALAHIGALKALEEFGFKPDTIVGVSMGSLIATAYSYFMDAEILEKNANTFMERYGMNLSYDKFLEGSFSKIVVKFGCWYMNTFSGMRFLANKLKKLPHFKGINFNIDLYLTATDYETGERVIFHPPEDDIEIALEASMALPGIVPPVEYKGRILGDGGIVDNLPTVVARDLGADFVIALDCSSNKIVKKLDSGNAVLLAIDSYRGIKMRNYSAKLADIYVNYDLGDMDTLEFLKGKWAIEKGYESVKRFLRGGEVPWNGR